MANERVQMEGLSGLLDNLKRLKGATQVNTANRALMKAAEPIKALAVDLVPIDEGNLKQSIQVSRQLTKRLRREKESKVEVHIGVASGFQGAINYATNVEYGTKFAGPQPFLRPAWETGKHQALEDIAKYLGEEIEKSVKRAERKAARGR